MFVYSGWNAAAYMAEEVRDPGRNLPLALALGTGAVTVIYILINVLYLKVIPIQELVTIKGSVLDVAAERLIGVRAGDVMGIVSIVSLAASVNAMTFAGPRVYFAMARDGVFLPAAARIHPTYKTPWISIAGQAAWATVLILTGSLDALGNYVAFAITLFAGIAVAAVFVLRARDPHAPRPFKAVGYPLDARHLRVLQLRDGGQLHLPRAARHRRRPAADRRGHPAVFLVHPAREEWTMNSAGPRRPPVLVAPGSSDPGDHGRGLKTPAPTSGPGRQSKRPGGRAKDHPPRILAGVRSSATRVRSASAPSLAANSRNDRGEPRRQ